MRAMASADSFLLLLRSFILYLDLHGVGDCGVGSNCAGKRGPRWIYN
jgi:hypothetical protein